MAAIADLPLITLSGEALAKQRNLYRLHINSRARLDYELRNDKCWHCGKPFYITAGIVPRIQYQCEHGPIHEAKAA